MFINSAGLGWALAQLSQWKADRGPRGLQNLFRLFLLKRLNVPIGPPATGLLLNSNDFRKVCREFLQVSYQDDETGSRTSQQPYYFNPFTFSYPKAVGSSDYAVGTMWTRCETWKSTGVIDFSEEERHQRRIAFSSDYLQLIREPLLRNGQTEEAFERIPVAALAVFLLRRPSDSGISTATIQTVTALIDLFNAEFHITAEEAATLLDPDVAGFPEQGFGDHEMSRTEVLDTIVANAPLPGVETPTAALEVGEGETEAAAPAGGPAIALVPDWAAAEVEDESPCGLYGQQATMRKAVSALRAGKHVILIGPPGTGKTELANCICLKLGVEFDLVTATSDWTTFDTIGGYMPDPSLRAGGTTDPLNFFPAIVSQSLMRHRWLIIDEINRADIDKAFGEMFTLLAGKSVRLPYKKRQGDALLDVVLGAPRKGEDVFSIPKPDHWRMIGTMNTFDKSSLFQLSFAFMRRFAFIDVPLPDRGHFVAALNSKSAALRQAEDDPGYEKCMELLRGIFAPAPGQGLAALGLAVGPAIALDSLKFLAEYRRLASNASASDLVLSAMEMYLYPQFEGQDAKHSAIMRVLSEILDLEGQIAAQTETRLAVWTGYEPSRGA